MKVLVIAFDNRPRYKTLIQYLEENEILYDFLSLSNSSVASGIKKIKKVKKKTRPTHTILIGFDKIAIIWSFICFLLREKQPIIRLGGDPINVPLSRTKENKQDWLTALKQTIRVSTIKIALKLPPKFITVSQSLADSEYLTKKNCFVLPVYPQSINTEPKKIRSSENIKLLTITNLNYYEKYQGVLLVIESALIVSRSQPITLSIVGGGSYLKQLKQHIKSQNQKKLKIIITGKIDNVEDYYNSADIFTYHSTLDSWPNVIMEAMAHGLPIVTNNSKQFSEVFCVKQRALLCEGNDEACFAKKITELITHNDFYTDCSRLSISRVSMLMSDKENISIFKSWLQKP